MLYYSQIINIKGALNMITLPIWLLVIIGIFGLPVLVGIIAFLVMCVQAIIIIFKEITKEL